MAVRYPATDSNKEWADELLALDQLVVEGFQTKPLRKLVVGSESKVDPEWGSIRVLQEVIQSRGASEEEAREIVRPFRELHSLRTTVRGHATGDSKKQAEKDARRNYGTLRAHFENLAKDCDQSLTVVRSTLDPTHSEQLS